MEFYVTTCHIYVTSIVASLGYSCHNNCRTCLTNHMASISFHITPLVINSIMDRHTHIHTQTCILMIHRVLWPECTWFKNFYKVCYEGVAIKGQYHINPCFTTVIILLVMHLVTYLQVICSLPKYPVLYLTSENDQQQSLLFQLPSQ